MAVPYKGTPPALTDLMGGQIDFMICDIGPALPLVTTGKLRALAPRAPPASCCCATCLRCRKPA
jgi:tripartite-type tricarboxylate transporter receptor subunit TctC